MSVYRASPRPDDEPQVEWRGGHALARLLVGVAAVPLAVWATAYLLTPAGALAILAMAWVWGYEVGRWTVLPPGKVARGLEVASWVAPLVGGTTIALALGRDLEVSFAEPWSDAVPNGWLAHLFLLGMSVRFARQLSRHAPEAVLLRTALTAAAGAALLAVTWLGWTAGACTSWGCPRELEMASLGSLPWLFVVASGVPHVPLFWWWWSARIRQSCSGALRPGFAALPRAASSPVGLSAALAGARRVLVARAGRTGAARVFVAIAAVAIARAVVAALRAEREPLEVLDPWLAAAPLGALSTWLLVRWGAARRFAAAAAASPEEAVAMAARLEQGSAVWPLLAGSIALPSLLAAAVSACTSDWSFADHFRPGMFVHATLLAFFPAHALIALAGVRFGIALPGRSSGVLGELATHHGLLAWLATILTTFIWADALGVWTIEVGVTAVFGGFLLFAAGFGGASVLISRERGLLAAAEA